MEMLRRKSSLLRISSFFPPPYWNFYYTHAPIIKENIFTEFPPRSNIKNNNFKTYKILNRSEIDVYKKLASSYRKKNIYQTARNKSSQRHGIHYNKYSVQDTVLHVILDP